MMVLLQRLCSLTGLKRTSCFSGPKLSGWVVTLGLMIQHCHAGERARKGMRQGQEKAISLRVLKAGTNKSSMRHLTSITSAIECQFHQPGYKVYSRLEDVLVKAANKENYEEDLEFICGFYREDLNQEQLKMQLDVMASNLPEEQVVHDHQSVLQYLRKLSDLQRGLLSNFCTLAQLLLVMPATNVVSERSFSSLRRVKTYCDQQ